METFKTNLALNGCFNNYYDGTENFCTVNKR